jgi:hypothetical protein
MNIRLQDYSHKTLFLAVHEGNSGTRLTFLYLNRMQEEVQAITLIPALPIVLAEKYGPKIWSWFNDMAKEETDGWYYDKQLGTVKSEDDRHTNNVVNEWNDNDSDDETAASDSETSSFTMDLDLLEGGLEQQIHSNPYKDGVTVNSRPLCTAFGGGDDSTMNEA